MPGALTAFRGANANLHFGQLVIHRSGQGDNPASNWLSNSTELIFHIQPYRNMGEIVWQDEYSGQEDVKPLPSLFMTDKLAKFEDALVLQLHLFPEENHTAWVKKSLKSILQDAINEIPDNIKDVDQRFSRWQDPYFIRMREVYQGFGQAGQSIIDFVDNAVLEIRKTVVSGRHRYHYRNDALVEYSALDKPDVSLAPPQGVLKRFWLQLRMKWEEWRLGPGKSEYAVYLYEGQKRNV